MKAEDVLKDLKTGNFAPVYFFQGEETFYIDRLSNYLEKHAIPEAERSFNQTILYGQDVQVTDILGHARRFPMMADKQLVLVKEAQQIRDLSREEGEKQLLNYLQHPVPSTILVFCHKHKKLDRRKAMGKNIGKYSVEVTCDKLRDYEVPKWLEEYIRSAGSRIEPNALQLLTESIGNDLERLSNEVNKILINFDQPVTITPDLVQKHVGISKEYNIFELQKAIGRKDRKKAFSIIKYFGANPRKHPAIPVIAILFAFFSKLLIAQKYRTAQPRELASKLGVPPFGVRDYQEALSFFSLTETIACIHLLRMADLQCKGVDSTNAEDGEILKELVGKILALRP